MARSTFRSQNVKSTRGSDHFWKLRCLKSARRCGAKHISKSKWTNTPCSDHFWKLRCLKSARRCGAKHTSKSKWTKHTMLGPLLEVEMSKKCTLLWREAHFEVKMLKALGVRTTFGRWDMLRCRFAWQAQGIVDLVKKCSKCEGFVTFPKTIAGVGHLKRIWKDAFSVAGAVQETCSSELLGGPGADLGVASWSLRFSGLLRWFCVTGAALRMTWHHFFRVRRITSDRWTGEIMKNRKTHWYEAVSSALNFPFLKEVSQNCFLIDVFNSKNEEVSQNCFVFDVIKLKHWGSLAELLRFWCCQLWKMKKSRRIASFLTLSSSNVREVSQNCCVFDVVKFKTWGRLAE